MATWDDAEQVTMEQWRDPARFRDVFRVDAAPAVVVMSEDVVASGGEHPEQPIVLRDGLIRWTFENCRCVYRVVDHDPYRRVYLCERLEAMGG